MQASGARHVFIHSNLGEPSRKNSLQLFISLSANDYILWRCLSVSGYRCTAKQVCLNLQVRLMNQGANRRWVVRKMQNTVIPLQKTDCQGMICGCLNSGVTPSNTRKIPIVECQTRIIYCLCMFVGPLVLIES